MIYIVIIISFVLENLLSKVLVSFFVGSSLVIIYPYFNNNDKKYLATSLIIGLLYDIVFTDTLFLNMIIFLLMAIVIRRLNLIISNNHINVMLLTLILIVLYQFINVIILSLIGYLDFSFSSILELIIWMIPYNLLYTFLMYTITDFFSKKYHILKID